MTKPLEIASDESSSFEPLDSLEAILEAARREGLVLAREDARFDQSGLDFLAVHARDEKGVPWIVRSPRRWTVVQAARVEARVVELLHSRLPVAVPQWRINTKEVIAYPRLDGVPAVAMDPEKGIVWNRVDPDAPSSVFIDSFARAVAALQAVDAQAVQDAGIPTKPIEDVRQAHASAMDAARPLLSPPDAIWARWHKWLDNDAIWPQHLALVHGDLHAGHLLLDEDGRITGILDWTEAHWGDPATDLAMFYGAFGRAALDDCIARFEAAGGRTWPGLAAHAAERWAAFPALMAKWGRDTNNEAVIGFAHMLLAAVAAGQR
jgi:macrolide phosphotransferase